MCVLLYHLAHTVLVRVSKQVVLWQRINNNNSGLTKGCTGSPHKVLRIKSKLRCSTKFVNLI